jgi:hypothetical protein
LQDADLEYSPEDFPVLLKPILDDRAELVLGSRFHSHGPKFFTKNAPKFSELSDEFKLSLSKTLSFAFFKLDNAATSLKHSIIIEIKSTYTYNKDLEKNIAKQDACVQQGFNFIFIINKDYSNFK